MNGRTASLTRWGAPEPDRQPGGDGRRDRDVRRAERVDREVRPVLAEGERRRAAGRWDVTTHTRQGRRRMNRYLLVLAALGAAVAALAGSAGAITGNYTDDFVHDNVGLLVFYTPNTPAGEDPVQPPLLGHADLADGHGHRGPLHHGSRRRAGLLPAVGCAELRPECLRRPRRRPDDGLSVPGWRHLPPGRQLRLSRGLPGDEGRRRRRARPAGDAAHGFGILPAAGAIDRYIAAAGEQEAAGAVHGQRLRPLGPGSAAGLVPGAADGELVRDQQRSSDHASST